MNNNYITIIYLNCMNKKIQVCLRLRPDGQLGSLLDAQSIRLPSRNETYHFDQVFSPQATTSHIFDHSIASLIDHSLQGYNVCVSAYGQTSSGKTFTMKGTPQQPGLIPLVVSYCFQKNVHSRMSISYVEIYNEQVYDLFSDSPDPIELTQQGLLSQNFQISSYDHFQQLYTQGEKRRKFGETTFNDHSSRSHAIFQVTIDSYNPLHPLDQTHSILQLVDLAGSENVSKAATTDSRTKEGININKSLQALKTVVTQLNEHSNSNNNNKYVNCRDSKLTRLMQKNLVGNSLTLFLLTVSQKEENMQESVTTMRFGVSVGALKTNAKKNIVSSDLSEISSNQRTLQDTEIEDFVDEQTLKLANQRIDTLESENQELRKQVEFLNGQLQEKLEQNERIQQLNQNLLFTAATKPVIEKQDASCQINLQDNENLARTNHLDETIKQMEAQHQRFESRMRREIEELYGQFDRFNEKLDHLNRCSDREERKEIFWELLKRSMKKLHEFEQELMEHERCQRELMKANTRNGMLRLRVDELEREVQLRKIELYDKEKRMYEMHEELWASNGKKESQQLQDKSNLKEKTFSKRREKQLSKGVMSPCDLKKDLFRSKDKRKQVEEVVHEVLKKEGEEELEELMEKQEEVRRMRVVCEEQLQ